MKPCAACQKPLVRHSKEKESAWLRRTVCNIECRAIRLNSKGKREKVCRRCGKTTLRDGPQNSATCFDCQAVWRRDWARNSRKVQREQARGFRVLMGMLGFPSLEETIAYLKTVPWVEYSGRVIRDLRGAA